MISPEQRFQVTLDVLRAAEKIYGYSIDSRAHEGSITILGTKCGTLNKPGFMATLFTAEAIRREEAQLLTYIADSSKPILVLGTTGCGKSSLLYSLAAPSETPQPTRGRRLLSAFRPIYINFKDQAMPHFGAVQGGVPGVALRDLLIDSVLGPMPSPPDRTAFDLAFLSWCMADDGARISEWPAISSELAPLKRELRATLAKALGKPYQDFTTAELREAFGALPDLAMFVPIGIAALNIRHLWAFLSSTTNQRRPLLLFDNLEVLAADTLTKLFQFTTTMYNAMTRPPTVVFALRHETLGVLGKRPNPGGDSQFIVDLAPYNAPTSPHVVAHSNEIFARRATMFESVMSTCTDMVKTTPRSDELEPEELMEILGTVRANTATLHAALRGILQNDRIVVAANSSIRQCSLLFTNFTEYLYFLADECRQDSSRKPLSVTSLVAGMPSHLGAAVAPGTSKAERDREKRAKSELKTLFYIWLRQLGKFRLKTSVAHTVCQPELLFSAIPTTRSVASCDHLVLSCIHNLATSPGPNGETAPPTVDVVVEYLGRLGFPEESVVKTLRAHLGRPGDDLLTVSCTNADPEPEDVVPGAPFTFCLSGLGTELLLNAYPKVGYLWGEILEKRKLLGDRRFYHEYDNDERLRYLWEHCVEIAVYHALYLTLVRVQLRDQCGAAWLDAYREWFGIGRSLQPERILEQAHVFHIPSFGHKAGWGPGGIGERAAGVRVSGSDELSGRVSGAIETPFSLLRDGYRRAIAESIEQLGDALKGDGGPMRGTRKAHAVLAAREILGVEEVERRMTGRGR
ncbi:MAG: hypothetical protein IT431_09660 [Phycisphaerales bacterium]|nr:hypothetical protein [Phycisphaerales bacterium]